MKFKLTTLLIMLVLSTTIIAKDRRGGKEIGNGGGAVVCRDQLDRTKVLYAQMYDNWEWKKLGIKESNDVSADILIKNALRKLKTTNSWFHKDLKHEIEFVKITINRFVKQYDVSLSRVYDSKHVMLPRLCPNGTRLKPYFEQVVNYQDKPIFGKNVYVSRELFNKFSETSKATLYMHEAIYKLLRKTQDEKDSRRSRRLATHLIAWGMDLVTKVEVDKALDDSFLHIEGRFGYNVDSLYKTGLFIPCEKLTKKGNSLKDLNKCLKSTFMLNGKGIKLSKYDNYRLLEVYRYNNLTCLNYYKKAISDNRRSLKQSKFLAFLPVINIITGPIAIIELSNLLRAKRLFKYILWAESLTNFGFDSYEESTEVRELYKLNEMRTNNISKIFRKDFLKHKKVRRRLKGNTREEKTQYLIKLLIKGNRNGRLCTKRSKDNARIASMRKIRKLIINKKLRL